MKIRIAIIVLAAGMFVGCAHKESLQSKLNTAYHRGYCDGRLVEIDFVRSNSIILP